MDEIDTMILTNLRKNARITMRDLGKQVGLTSPAVTERVKKMEDAGIIKGYHAEINMQNSITDSLQAQVSILVAEKDIEDFIAYCKKNEKIIRVDRMLSADNNFIISIITNNSHELEKEIINLHRYGMTKTAIYLSTYFQR